MAIFDGFIGPSYTAQSLNADSESSMNLYAEAIEGGGNGKAKVVLYGTPGLTAAFCTLATSPVRGLWANATRLFAVAGADLYEVFANGTFVNRSTAFGSLPLANDGLPVQIFPNGNQLLIVSGGIAYCDNGAGPVQPSFGARTGTAHYANLLTGSQLTWVSGDKFDASMVGQTFTINTIVCTVTAVYSTTSLLLSINITGANPGTFTSTFAVAASSGAFLDGYFLVAQPNSKQFNFSNINDGTTWDTLDYATKSAYPDNIVALLSDHEEVWIFGSDTAEVWQNTGAALNPFSRIPGALIHHGCVASASPVRLQNGVAWLSSDPVRGGIIAYLAQGFTPARISTHAVETAWSAYSAADAVSFTYTDQGHEFWVITFPNGGSTWVFDATMGWWHQRGFWNGATIDRQRQIFHAFAFGKHLVGDWSTGVIYEQSLTALDDAGTPIHRVRTAPHLSNEALWSFYSRFQLDLELGQSTSTPGVTLEWSDDGGHTFNTPVTATPTTATFAAMIVWRRLGKSRDRVFRVTITDAVKIALIRAILDVEQGTR
jgi:hypothetical protein